jgi:hypothetical protein
LVIADLTATEEIQRDYPEDLKACRETAANALGQCGKYRSVVKSEAQKGPTLVVKTNVPKMRIVGFNARFWGGGFAGTSEMLLELTLTDKQTGAVMARKTLSSSVNVMGATWFLRRHRPQPPHGHGGHYGRLYRGGSSRHHSLIDVSLMMGKRLCCKRDISEIRKEIAKKS